MKTKLANTFKQNLIRIRNIYIVLIVSFTTNSVLATTNGDDAGDVGKVIGFGISVTTLIGTLIVGVLGVFALYAAAYPLIKSAISDSQPGGQRVPWVRSLLLGLAGMALVAGGFSIILKSAHITDSTHEPVKMQSIG